MIKNVKVENDWVFIERDNGLTSSISLRMPLGHARLDRWDNMYAYLCCESYRFTYNEDGICVNSEVV